MVGIAIGLFILAGATLTVTGQLSENRRLLADTELQQDLRVAADIVSRDIRRAAYTGASYQSVWPTTASAGLLDVYAAMSPESTVDPVNQVTYSYSRAANPGTEDNVVTSDEFSGFRLNPNTRALEMQLGSGNWQTLTDPSSMLVTRFDVTVNGQNQPVPCAQQCPVGPSGCPLQLTTRSVSFLLVGQSTIDLNVTRTLQWTIRLRNDVVREAC